jgi:hypothetical protein
MHRFDLLDEFTCVAAPRLSAARGRNPDHPDADSRRQSGTANHLRYGAAGAIAVLLIAIVAL